ncbi:ribbon-helix-helix domain-containing protein [Methylobacterium dankookense]|uniref:ribbon-helix-helix domain-containing protein n=1 Tax=Methylobacterium dankookense TaxID=560405 RepID=UPI00119FD12E|nr:hypothetical protein [Methylobacterium dankookense]
MTADPDQREAAELETLREAIQEGLASGPPEPLDMAEIRAEARARAGLPNHSTPSERNAGPLSRSGEGQGEG